jgi:hypothetical protein
LSIINFKCYGVMCLGDTRVEIILERDPQDQWNVEGGPKFQKY